MRKFRLLVLLLTACLALSVVPATAAAASPLTVVLDGKALNLAADSQVINGRTMVPYRALAEQIGATVSWDEAAKKVTVRKDGTTVELTIGSKQAKLNGQSIALESEPVVKNGHTLVPLRFVSTSLGLWINWDAASRTVKIDSSKTIRHSMGEIRLDKVPQRVVVLFNGMVDIAVSLGVKPVGAVESWEEKPWFLYLRSKMDGVRNLGEESQPNLEAIVALKPDLIIASKGRHEQINGQLSAIAPTLMTDEVFGWKDNLAIAAEALGRQDEATQILNEWDNRVAAFKQKMGTRLKDTEVSIIRFQPDGTARVYVTGFAGSILDELGLSRPKAQQAEGKSVINLTSKEQIPTLDGDVIFDISRDRESETDTRNDWTSHPLWSRLKGVKNDQYYSVDVITWNLGAGSTAAKLMLDDLYNYFDLR